MHTKEELDLAILNLYKDYKDAINDYKKGDINFFQKLEKINNDSKKYTTEEVYYIAFNVILLFQEDNNIID